MLSTGLHFASESTSPWSIQSPTHDSTTLYLELRETRETEHQAIGRPAFSRFPSIRIYPLQHRFEGKHSLRSTDLMLNQQIRGGIIASRACPPWRSPNAVYVFGFGLPDIHSQEQQNLSQPSQLGEKVMSCLM
jgi:hypothetical protein